MTRRLPPPPVVDAGLALRRRLLRAADAMLPATTVIWERTMGIGRTHVVGTLAELGVADALGGERLTAAQLATRLHVDAGALHRVMRAAADDGLLRLDRRGRFRLTRLGRALRSDAPLSSRPWARYMALESTRGAWAGLTGSVRTGEPAFRRVHGSSVWEWFAAHPDEERLFAAAMRVITEFETPDIAASDLWPASGTVCDLAGGVGPLLAALLAERPGLRGVLVEAPGVLAEAEAYFAGKGIRERVELVEGDLLGRLEVPADVYVLKNILHDWGDADCARILATVRATMAPGARLLVVEQLQEPNRPEPVASWIDLVMLTQCDGGRQRSREELRGLLAGAGLRPGRLQRVGGTALVEGVA